MDKETTLAGSANSQLVNDVLASSARSKLGGADRTGAATLAGAREALLDPALPQALRDGLAPISGVVTGRVLA